MVDVSHPQSHVVVGWGRQDGPMVSVAVVGLLAGNVVPARVQYPPWSVMGSFEPGR